MGDCGRVTPVLIWLASRAGGHPHEPHTGDRFGVHQVLHVLRPGFQVGILVLGLVLDAGSFRRQDPGRRYLPSSTLVIAPRALESLLLLILLIPTFAVAVRRLHDVDRSGWWLLMYFTIIGIFFPLLIWKCTKGTYGANRFGPDPLGIDAQAVEVFS
jgi:uncharacterized membrane protein YhaH (DUF805 family)